MSNCFQSCGDCGKAKKEPGSLREGTRNSRAPSGVDGIKNGVSTSTNPLVSISVRIALLICARTRRFFCILSRRISRYRYFSRIISSTSSARASTGNGGGSAEFKISTTQSPISTMPVVREELIVPSGRARTTPVTRMTYSLRTSTSLSTTHCMIPE